MRNKVLTTMMSIFAVALSLILPMNLFGCADETPQKPQAVTPYAIKNFVNFVTNIQTPITVDSGAEIEAGYIIYEHLKDEYKNNKDVQGQKEILDDYKAQYEVIKAEQDRLDAEAEQAAARSRFEKAVERIPGEDKLTVGDKTAIAAAYALYEKLDAASRDVASVKSAYAKLQAADKKVRELEEEARLAAIKQKADEFVNGVDELTEDDITLASKSAIEDLQYLYDKLPDEAKEYDSVIEAKQKLDAAAEEYKALKDESDVKEFLKLIKALPSSEDITLDHGRDIVAIETLYENMSEEAKSVDGVAEAHKKLVAARNKYDELFAEAEKIKIQEFIEAANAVPLDIENVDITWFDVLNNASEKYWALSYASQSLPEVLEAVKRWDAAQTAFDKKGYKRIPMTNPGMALSGDNPPHLVLQLHENMLKPILNFYGVATLAELDNHAVLVLNVYVDGTLTGKADIAFASLINEGHILPNTAIVNALKALSATNDKIVSGSNFSFSLSVRDKNNEHIPSAETAVSASKNTYTW